MQLINLLNQQLALPIANQIGILNILIIIFICFGILLIIGLRKSYQLKKENERLEAMNAMMDSKNDDDEEKPYQDFTDGHMYGGNN
ncbi:hypothetical protein KO493_14720 [Tamlana agarivorans]|uniref:Uncharacterized protein n=1 Tax=Pseudotamlana agarivorans TaxID=481183 RepID=A0ACC5UC98_9FLAO|nr:hypothetical protein [Tamlana agarivorans]MBU2951951.1 hypothetical protein [Tamlana agarivorans]